MFNSIRLRLTAWYVFVLLAIVAATGVITFVMLSRSLSNEVDDSLRASAGGIGEQIEAGGLQSLGTPPPSLGGGETGDDGEHDGEHDGEGDEEDEDEDHDVRFFTPQSGDTFYLVVSPSGSVLANPLNVRVPGLPDSEQAAIAAGQGESWTELTADGDDYRIHSLAVREEGEITAVVQVGRSLEQHEQQLQDVMIILAVSGLAGIALAAVGGLILAGRALAPAQEALERQREFVSDASHELRTPLTIVRGNAEMLDMTAGANLTDEARGYVGGIVGQVKYMERLTDDLSLLARMEQGEAPLQRQDFDLEPLLSEVAADARIMGRGKGITVNGSSEPIVLNADRDRLRQAVMVLLDNAVRVAPLSGRIDVRGIREQGEVRIEVSDNGPGIPPEHLARVFDRFYRVDTGRSRDEGGRGLGLAIAKAIIEAHGGSIIASNRAEGGASFAIVLPA